MPVEEGQTLRPKPRLGIFVILVWPLKRQTCLEILRIRIDGGSMMLAKVITIVVEQSNWQGVFC